MELTDEELLITYYHLSVSNDVIDEYHSGSYPYTYLEAYDTWKRVITEVRRRNLCKPDGYPEDE